MIIKQKIQAISEKLIQLPVDKKLNWVSDILTEVIPHYQKFSNENQFGNVAFFTPILELVNQASNALISPNEIEKLRMAFETENIIPDTEEFGMLSASLALNVCVIADYALEFLQENNPETLTEILRNYIEIAEMQHSKDLNPNLKNTAWESALWAKSEFRNTIEKLENQVFVM